MNWQEFISWELFSRDTLDIKKCYIDIANDLVAGILLSQIIYWNLPSKNGDTKLKASYKGKPALVKSRADWWDECRITIKQYNRAIGILKDKKLVLVDNSMFNGKRTPFIRLNRKVLIGCLESVQPVSTKGNDRKVPKVTTLNRDYNKDYNKLSRRNDSECFEGLEKETNTITKPKGYSLAIKLKKILKRNNKITRTPNLSNWSKEFKDLLSNISKKEILQTLKWYDKHMKDQYVPKAYAAKSFCENYNRIVDAMKRAGDHTAPLTKKDKKKKRKLFNEFVEDLESQGPVLSEEEYEKEFEV